MVNGQRPLAKLSALNGYAQLRYLLPLPSTAVSPAFLSLPGEERYILREHVPDTVLSTG